MGRPWVKERTRRLSWRSERRLRSLLCCQQQRGKILLQGDSVVKVTKSFPAFPSSNYSTTGMVELEVQFPVYFCVFCRQFHSMFPPSICCLSRALFAFWSQAFFVMTMKRNLVFPLPLLAPIERCCLALVLCFSAWNNMSCDGSVERLLLTA